MNRQACFRSLLWLGLSGWASPALAAPAPPPQALRFEADRLDVDPVSGVVVAQGRVRLRMPPYEVRCDQARLEGRPGAPPTRMRFSGHVEVRRGAEHFSAPQVTYDGSTRRWRAEGGARVQLLLPPGAWSDPAASRP